MANAPGSVRDAVEKILEQAPDGLCATEIHYGVERLLGASVPRSSVQSSLQLRGKTVERISRGKYRLKKHASAAPSISDDQESPHFATESGLVYNADCFDHLDTIDACSIHALVTDPPYGLVEYTAQQQDKLRSGKGGIWRIPPSFDGVKRNPLPRFTTLTKHDYDNIYDFFFRFGLLASRVLVPGANVIVASNPLVAPWVSLALSNAGLELRGNIIRLVQTMRGGDRPKGSESDYHDVSVMPRSQWEPWIILRKPLDGTVSQNLAKWNTGGFKRISDEKPFGDVIKSHPTHKKEREIAPHPSLKPQSFMRKIVRAALPLGKGTILDPFCGGGSTIAAADAVGYASIGIEKDPLYYEIAETAIQQLATLEE